LVEFFRPHPEIEADRGLALRVSRYVGPTDHERHVRFSVWSDSSPEAEAQAAISLDVGEAQRLAEFLILGAPKARTGVLERLGLSIAKGR
jgi:hypothetical protein